MKKWVYYALQFGCVWSEAAEKAGQPVRVEGEDE